MKKIILLLMFTLVSNFLQAKQIVEYYRYYMTVNVALSASNDLKTLIEKGYRIISFSLDYSQKTMIVVYDDGKKENNEDK